MPNRFTLLSEHVDFDDGKILFSSVQRVNTMESDVFIVKISLYTQMHKKLIRKLII